MNNQRKDQNNKLCSGERQVRNVLDKIDKWHKWRYYEALKYITPNDRVLDLGMGCGYGSRILSLKAKEIIGVDDCKGAVDYAKKHWNNDNIKYYHDNIFNVKGTFDVVTAFEIIEHVKDTEQLFNLMKQWAGGYIVLSVPHISVPVKRSRWHWRHFTVEDIKQYITNIGFEVERIETPRFGKGLAVFCVAKRREQ